MKQPLNTKNEIERQRINAQIKDIKRRYLAVSKEILSDTDNANDLELTRKYNALSVKLNTLNSELEKLGKPPRIRCRVRKN